jgi:hypothetical protein
VPNKRAADQVALSISMPRAMLVEMEKYCVNHDITKSQYIRRLIRDDETRYGSIPVGPAAEDAAVEGCPHRKIKAAS